MLKNGHCGDRAAHATASGAVSSLKCGNQRVAHLAIDRRSAGAKMLLAWKDALTDALGGPDAISPQKAALIDTATRTKLLLDHCDAFIMTQRSLINRRTKGVYPIVRDRTALAESLTGLLKALGLEKVPKPVPTLSEYLARREKTQLDVKSEPVEKVEDGETGNQHPGRDE
jgi:hypothetical protein